MPMSLPGVSPSAFNIAKKSTVAAAVISAFAFSTPAVAQGVASDLPTCTLTNASGSFITTGIPSAQLFPALSGSATTTTFAYPGAAVAQYGETFPRSSIVAGISNTTTNSNGNVSPELMFDGAQLEIPLYWQSGNIRVMSGQTEICRIAPTMHNGTLQAGSGTTATLASGASASTGIYTTRWLYILTGTGAGSYARITAYNGGTKVATVDPASGSWVAPDSTSTYEVRKFQTTATSLALNSTIGQIYNLLLTFPTRALRRIRIEMSVSGFWGVRTDATAAVYKPIPTAATPIFLAGDSFTEGTGADLQTTGFAPQLAAKLGLVPWMCGSGGTGYLNGSIGNGRLNITDRLAPSPNSWKMYLGNPTAGTFTLSYNGQTTSALAYNASMATIQSALAGLSNVGASFTGSISGNTLTVSAVASGTLRVGQIVNGSGVNTLTYISALGTGTGGVGTYTLSVSQTVSSVSMTSGSVSVNGTFNFAGGQGYVVLFTNELASISNATFTVGAGSLTSAKTPSTAPYLGDIAPYAPVDPNGNTLPFYIALFAGHNDSADTNANFTPAILQSTVADLITRLKARFPIATILMTGVLYLPNNASANTLAANVAIKAAASTGLPNVNGIFPFIDTVTPPAWITGTGNIGVPIGSGASDFYTDYDGVHPSQLGHNWYANRIATGFYGFLSGQSV